MLLPSRFWSDLTTRQFAQLRDERDIGQVVAVLPVGATEQHGPHLPLSVDSDLVEAIVAGALPLLAAELPVLVLPTQGIGKSNEHARFPGTLSLSAETLIRIWTEIGDAVAATGIRKLLLFNAHGGQVGMMDIVARDLRARHDLIVYSSNWYDLPIPDAVMAPFGAAERRFGVHAGDVETSMMLALRARRVDMTQARDFVSTSQARAAEFPILGNGRSAKLAWQMQDVNAMGAAGNAAAASAAKGRALLDAAAQQLSLLLAELSRLPLSTLVARPAFPD
jgi:creatinine amidohydrolase